MAHVIVHNLPMQDIAMGILTAARLQISKVGLIAQDQTQSSRRQYQ